MDTKSLALVLVAALALARTDGRAQTPTPARGTSPAKPQQATPGRESTPAKAWKLQLDCPKEPVPYHHRTSYYLALVDRQTGGAMVGVPAKVEMKLDGVVLPFDGGTTGILGAGWFGDFSVPLSVAPGLRTLRATADGNLEASCPVVVKKTASKIDGKAWTLDVIPEALRSLHLPGTKYLRVHAQLEMSFTLGWGPAKGQKVRFRLNGKELKAATTDDNGKVILDARADPGTNVVELIFDGNANVLESSASVTLQVPK